jgi:hypothetical protein
MKKVRMDDFKVFRKSEDDIGKCETMMKYAASYIMDKDHIYKIDFELATWTVKCTDLRLSLTKKSGEKTHPCNNGKCLNGDELRCIAIADTIHDMAINEFLKNEMIEQIGMKNPDMKGYDPPENQEPKPLNQSRLKLK